MHKKHRLPVKLIASFFFGFSGGIPLALIISTLNAWLAEAGLSKITIGVFAVLGFPYIFKFIWSPLLDYISLPILAKKFGKKRSWLFLIQILLVFSIIMLGNSDPTTNLKQVAFFAFMVSFFSATQDIIVDSYRISILDDREQGIGSSSAIFGDKAGVLLSGGITLFFIDQLCKKYGLCENFINWAIGYAIVSIFVFSASIMSIIIGEPPEKRSDNGDNLLSIKKFIVTPYLELRKQKNWILILIFILTYRLCDTLIASMTNPFLIDLGFSLTEIAFIVKTFGLIAMICGSILGGAIVYRYGIMTTIFIGGALQMFSNLMFVIQAKVGYSSSLLYITIATENSCGSVATAALFAYISKLASNSYFSGTVYAFLSSLSAIDRVFLPIISGFIVEKFGWITLFNTSVIIGAPPLLLMVFIYKSQVKINA
jgi:PAT family beta-lactamase induction signal transducer AmpG